MKSKNTRVPVQKGLSSNAINVSSFRKQAITSYIEKNTVIQFCAFYNKIGEVIIARRHLPSVRWDIIHTHIFNNMNDAHNGLSIIVDGNKTLHICVPVHNKQLRYYQMDENLNLSKKSMIGSLEDQATYPEFYRQKSGNLLFLYRNGSAGSGNVVLNQYDTENQRWIRLHDNVIDGENQCSPYWQACVDHKDRLHISWCWRRTSDVQTNFDLCYIVSCDASCRQFMNDKQKILPLPITKSSEGITICPIPENSMLINQTSMTVNTKDHPYIISIYRQNKTVQYHLHFLENGFWHHRNLHLRHSDFSLSGRGTKKLPCARPQILADDQYIYLLLRDQERNNWISLARIEGIQTQITNLYSINMGQYEPLYDSQLWSDCHVLHLFVQKCTYVEDHTLKRRKTDRIYILEVEGL